MIASDQMHIVLNNCLDFNKSIVLQTIKLCLITSKTLASSFIYRQEKKIMNGILSKVGE